MDVSKKKRIAGALGAFVIISLFIYWFSQTHSQADDVTIYGNIDIRQVQTAFYVNGRILHMYVQEGDRVKKGQLLAELDPIRFQQTVLRSRGQLAAQEATLKNAQILLQRNQALVSSQAVSRQNLDDASSSHAVAQQTLQANRAALALAEQDLIDSKLYAPLDGIIQDRILEPGDMVTPQNTVFSLALDNPLWVRAYLPEKLLGQVQLGMKAWIHSDSFPDRRFAGWVGFISPIAEFTPKNVETTELRTELVYQVRVYACNPKHDLRLGMPVTVNIPIRNNQPQSIGEKPCES